MIFVYNLCPASRKCQYLTSGFERCDGAQVRLLIIDSPLMSKVTGEMVTEEKLLKKLLKKF